MAIWRSSSVFCALREYVSDARAYHAGSGIPESPRSVVLVVQSVRSRQPAPTWDLLPSALTIGWSSVP